MRQTLAGIILRLLGARVVYEEADLPTPLKREASSSPSEALFYSVNSLSDQPGEGLFDRLVCVLHALLGSSKPSWLKPKLATSKSTIKSPRDFPPFDREAAENLQVSLLKISGGLIFWSGSLPARFQHCHKRLVTCDCGSKCLFFVSILFLELIIALSY
jgi:hypothetical protein